MGDMNTTTKDNLDRTGGKEPKGKKEWIKMLKDFELYDTYRQHNKNTIDFTWGNETQSRIDMIWLSEDMKELCKGATIEDTRHQLNTDHKAVSAEIDLYTITKEIKRIRTTNERKVYDYKQMNEEKWEEWRKEIEQVKERKKNKRQSEREGNEQEGEEPNNNWKDLKERWKEAAERVIPKKTHRTDVQAFSKKIKTAQFTAFRKLNKALNMAKEIEKKGKSGNKREELEKRNQINK